MPKPDTKQQPTVTVRIVPGTPTPASWAMWRKFFQRLIAEAQQQAQDEARNERHD